MGKLYCVPLGQSARELFARTLQQQPHGQGVLVLPTRVLMQETRSKYGIEVMGIDDLADKLLQDNGYMGLQMITRRSQELVIAEVIEYLARQDKLTYFQQLSGKKGFIKAVTSLVSQLSASGVNEQQIGKILRSWDGRTGFKEAKDLEVASLYGAYRAYLKSENRLDLEGKYRLALRILQQERPRLRWREIYISDFFDLDALKLDFLKALAKHCQVTIGLTYETGREQLLQAVEPKYGALAGFCSIEQYAEQLTRTPALEQLARNFRRRCTPIPAQGGVSLHKFATREEELRWNLRQIKQLLQQGVPAEEILLTARDLSKYSGLRQIADEYGLPVSLGLTTSLPVQPITELVLLLLQAATDNRQGAQAYFAILQSALGKQLFSVDTEVAESWLEDRYYTQRSQVQQRCQKVWPEEPLLQQVDQLLEDLNDPGSMATYVELLTNFLQELDVEHRVGRLYQQGKINLLTLKGCLQGMRSLQKCLQDMLADYQSCRLSNNPLGLQDFLDVLLEALPSYNILLAKGRGDGVLVTEVMQAQGLHYQYLFMLGLREGECPQINNENWLYDDAERSELAALGIEMPNTAQHYAEDAYFFAMLLAQTTQRISLSWFQDDQGGASPYVDEVKRLFTDVEIQGQHREEFASPQELWALGHGCDEQWLATQLGPLCLQAAAVDDLRIKEPRYRGVLQEAELLEAVGRRVGYTFSASALEMYAQCPFSYLGTKIWQQQELVAKDELATPQDEGSLLHEILADFMKLHLGESLSKYKFEELWQELQQVFSQDLEAYGVQGRLEQNPLWQGERHRLLHMLLRWLYFEYNEQAQGLSFVPCQLEWDFGQQSGRPVRITLPDGRRVQLQGRIDRIDTDGQQLFILDYKRSRYPSKKDLERGLDLQLPLYLLAADQLGKPVAGGGYFVLKDTKRVSGLAILPLEAALKADTKLFAEQEEPWRAFKEFSQGLIAGYISGIYNGEFAVQPQKLCDDFCPLREICRVGKGDEEHA